LSAARTDDGASPRRLKRRLKRILSVAGLSLLTLAGLVVAVLLAWRAYEQHRIREATKITSPSGIESLEKVTLGGVEQWILIRGGHDRAKPPLLFLHGGPGLPNMPLAHVNAAL
jgi:hypothetical protein